MLRSHIVHFDDLIADMNQARTVCGAANHYPRDDDLSSLLVGFYCGTLN